MPFIQTDLIHNFNKKINSLANKIENNFLNKYKYEYNFKKIE